MTVFTALFNAKAFHLLKTFYITVFRNLNTLKLLVYFLQSPDASIEVTARIITPHGLPQPLPPEGGVGGLMVVEWPGLCLTLSQKASESQSKEPQVGNPRGGGFMRDSWPSCMSSAMPSTW